MDLASWFVHALAGVCIASLATWCGYREGETAMILEVTSAAFTSGAEIPKKYTEDGKDLSPPLHWDHAPAGTKEFALICDDPDAPTPEPWVHWVLYKIPANVHALPEGLSAEAQLTSPAGALQGLNSWRAGRMVGYRGPAPPRGHGTHHYHFRLYALNAPLALAAKADKKTLLKAMKGYVLAEGELVGTYER